jgi:hypothetical protein
MLLTSFKSPKTDQEYAEQLAPFLLNTIYEIYKGDSINKVLKIGAFDACSAGGHKGDKNKLEQYKKFRHDATYYRDVENALQLLYRRGLARPHASPGHVAITEAGIQMCERSIDQGGWHFSIFHPGKIDPRLMRLK